MEKNQFTLSLALVDALPVLFFGAAAAMLGVKLRSALFIVGAALCLLAGAGKVAWKLLLALRGKDVAILGAQLRYVMPAGFLLMLLGAFLAERETVRTLLHDGRLREEVRPLRRARQLDRAGDQRRRPGLRPDRRAAAVKRRKPWN